jgi:Phage tail baseplate hub (GPD)/PAAR motif
MRPVVLVGHRHECPKHGAGTVFSGTAGVTINGREVACIGHAISCGAAITSGSSTVTLKGKVVSFTLNEALSEPFLLDVQLSSDSAAADFGNVLDQPALFTIWRGETAVRRVHGVVSGFSQGTTGFRRTRYQATVEPLLARADLRSGWRIFQQRSVPEILQGMIKEQRITAYTQYLAEPHLAREYCVQAKRDRPGLSGATGRRRRPALCLHA